MGIDASIPPPGRRVAKKYRPPHLLRRPNRRADIILIVVLTVLSIVSASYSIYSTSRLLDLQNYHKHMDHILSEHIPHPPVKAEALALESAFSRTVKSCLPSLDPRCRTVPGEEHVVALVAPPGDFSNYIFQWATTVVQSALLGSTTHMHIDLVSHVPPYTKHGYHKVIRILPESLMLGASDALRGTLTLGKTPQVLRLEDLKASLRQLLRFHCRISGMADHTPVLTLDMVSVQRAPRIVANGLLNFLNVTAADHGEVDVDDIEENEDSGDESGYHTLSNSDLELKEMGQTLHAYAESLLTWIQKHEHVQVKQELNSVLENELLLSNNFTQCLSFWSTGEGADGTQMSSFARRLAMSLVPDCSADKCTHVRDICEERGDTVCQGAPPFPMHLPRSPFGRQRNVSKETKVRI